MADLEAVKGKRVVYLFRLLSEKSSKTGTRIAFTTNNSKTLSKDAETTATKDGTIRTPGAAEVSISCDCILSNTEGIIEELRDAMLNDKLIEIWEANLDRKGTGPNKFKGTYFQGYLTSMDITTASEGFAEVSLEFGINGQGVDGDVTVTAEQQKDATYVFTDTTVSG